MTEAMIRKKPGMASVMDMPLLQDGPPPGGSPSVRYARRVSNTVAIFRCLCLGMYQVGQGNKIRRARKRNTLHVEQFYPFFKQKKMKGLCLSGKVSRIRVDVLKDVPGWKVGENVYNSGRWMPPATGELRPDVW